MTTQINAYQANQPDPKEFNRLRQTTAILRTEMDELLQLKKDLEKERKNMADTEEIKQLKRELEDEKRKYKELNEQLENDRKKIHENTECIDKMAVEQHLLDDRVKADERNGRPGVINFEGLKHSK